MKKIITILIMLIVLAFLFFEIWYSSAELWIKICFTITGCASLLGLYLVYWCVVFNDVGETEN